MRLRSAAWAIVSLFAFATLPPIGHREVNTALAWLTALLVYCAAETHYDRKDRRERAHRR